MEISLEGSVAYEEFVLEIKTHRFDDHIDDDVIIYLWWELSS